MELLKQIAIILVLVFIATWISAQIKKYILPKYKIKKVYVLIAGILLFIAYFVLAWASQNNAIVQYTVLTLICIFMTTYVDMVRTEKEEKNKPVVGRPMAKPRRANKESK